ncbi:ALP1-like protein [Tanacetum coccineum]
MSQSLFTGIVEELTLQCEFFYEKEDCTGKLGISLLIKCTSAIRQLTYSTIPDALDEYLQMGNATSRQSLEIFCTSIVHIFGPEFLRKPTLTDVERLYAFHENKHKFPGMLEVLIAVASNDLWIWHAFFGVSGLNNDINVTQRSPLLNDLKLGKAPEVPFVANGYKTMHEAARKDVERAFGVLKKKWAILASPARAYIKEKLANIMYTCIILHNMIIKDRKESISPKWYPEEEHQPDYLLRSDEQRYRVIRYIRSSEAHQMLKADLIEHVNRNRND